MITVHIFKNKEDGSFTIVNRKDVFESIYGAGSGFTYVGSAIGKCTDDHPLRRMDDASVQEGDVVYVNMLGVPPIEDIRVLIKEFTSADKVEQLKEEWKHTLAGKEGGVIKDYLKTIPEVKSGFAGKIDLDISEEAFMKLEVLDLGALGTFIRDTKCKEIMVAWVREHDDKNERLIDLLLKKYEPIEDKDVSFALTVEEANEFNDLVKQYKEDKAK